MYGFMHVCISLREVYLSRSDTGKVGTLTLVLKSTNTGGVRKEEYLHLQTSLYEVLPSVHMDI